MNIKNKFDKNDKNLLDGLHIDLEEDYDYDKLEALEDIIYNKMMDNLDENQNFTPKANKYEHILDIIVDLENNYNENS